MPAKRSESHSLAEKVAAAWRAEIRSGDLAPGTQIDFDRYRAQFAVSISPLRDASKLLETEGLVRIVPRRGVYVAEVNTATLLEAYAIRIALEPLVVSLATSLIPAERIKEVRRQYRSAAATKRQSERDQRLLDVDHLIHALVLEFCPNKRLSKIMSDNSSYVDWCRDVGPAVSKARWSRPSRNMWRCATRSSPATPHWRLIACASI